MRQNYKLIIIVCWVVAIIIIFVGMRQHEIFHNASALTSALKKSMRFGVNEDLCRETQKVLRNCMTFLVDLKNKEKRVYSQNQEDGIIEAIFKQIGTKDKYFVEFGVESGVQCNTRYLREKHNWTGLMMDGGNYKPEINLQKEMIYPSNIVQLFEKYKVPKKFDLLSVDTDFKDFWLMKNILSAGYRPRVLIAEFNCFLGPTASKTVPLDLTQTRWDGTQYFGFSVMAGWHLGRQFGYSMVYCESMLVNCFWVIDGEEGFGKGVRVSDYVRGSAFWQRKCTLGHRKDVQNRKYVEISEITK